MGAFIPQYPNHNLDEPRRRKMLQKGNKCAVNPF
jgi:hypothetical protein